ncbi:MAG: tRNA (N(6)-L-threonylcarbamoyladenosine(37)-C(2))-methylthiotransferase MtaB [Xanthobacteraceae bacterium]|nr:tRNA (N(6)-L-threonylcarbamoyladenosine(37)-C(2))-methylthiotransferase MtaB [Xanthobacteraceae bacterium]MCW5673135.1 tRNA (N(6)-L-threonylcarbamoyladenosine(37)-C(2))-methylthiotransferase MtaB [Xanthobacteraceae bacterium]
MPVEVVTFGCRLNITESETIRRHAEAARLTNTIIVNSCAVTAEAVRQARQQIRRMKRERPEAKIVVTGCAAQTESETFASMPEVAAVVGNARKLDAATWTVPFGSLEKVQIDDLDSIRETALHLVDGFEGHTRAFVQIQNGCDHSCTFCIIPFGRGPSRSVGAGEVISQIRALTERGYREVVLTGVDLTSWGGDLPGTPKLGSLVRQILKHVPELPRLRISSIDSIEVDDDFMRALAEEERLMPHLHLSLQAGDDLILKRMKRRHMTRDAIRFTEEARRLRPDIVFGADFIAGFPTETETHFANTMQHAEDCGLTFLHVFPFSPRNGTPAARMPQVSRAIAKERAGRLRAKGDELLHRHFQSEIGKSRRVLVEQSGVEGRSEHFMPVKLAKTFARGAIAEVRIASHDERGLLAA